MRSTTRIGMIQSKIVKGLRAVLSSLIVQIRECNVENGNFEVNRYYAFAVSNTMCSISRVGRTSWVRTIVAPCNIAIAVAPRVP